jgi:hypothetical protein
VKNTKNPNAIFFLLHVVDENVMPVNDEFARAAHAAAPAHVGLIDQQFGLSLEQLVEVDRGDDVIRGDVIENGLAIRYGDRRPG